MTKKPLFLRRYLVLALSMTTLIGLVAIPTSAKVFRTSYISFELPDRWECDLQGTEWVCRTKQPGTDAREATIIFTAKEVGPSDSIDAYISHLRTPRQLASKTGKSASSQVLKVEKRKIANQEWADGMHLSSEVANYYTRYLATTKEQIAVLITFSAHKLHYTKYSADFFRAIESLRVIATKDTLGTNGNAGGLGVLDTFGSSAGLGGPTDGLAAPEEDLGQAKSKTSSGQFMLLAGVILAAVAIYLWLKGRK